MALLMDFCVTTMGSATLDTCRVLVIEDHTLVREAMVGALDRLGRQCEILQAACAQDALALIERDSRLDLVLVDLMLPDMSGFSLVSVLAHRFPTIPVVVVSAMADEASVKRALKAGATGFLSKSISSDQLVDSISRILDGQVVTPETSAPTIPSISQPKRRGLDSIATQFGLTAAQTRVMELMVEGRTNREIATLLHLAEGTVKVHCSAILRALGVPNRAQALVVMARHGLLRP
jgi:DNA-binding NarL/FixJ family response regulator